MRGSKGNAVRDICITAVVLCFFLLVRVPEFFEIYRIAAFNAVPRDDYAPYLLSLIGKEGDTPGAPFAYRVISVAVAIPFYYILPLYKFTNLGNVDLDYLRATQCLSFASFLWLVLIPIIIYSIARKKYSSTRVSSALIALLSILLNEFMAKCGIDPFAILTISLLVMCFERPALFAALILISVGINEKIPFLFATVIAFRLVVSWLRRRPFPSLVQLLSSCAAVAIYFALVHLFPVQGNERLLNPTLYPMKLLSTLMLTFSLKGLISNVIPLLVLMFVIVLAAKANGRVSFQVSDVSGLLVLVLLALLVDVKYNVGRIAMYSYPLYLPAVSIFIDNFESLRGLPKTQAG